MIYHNILKPLGIPGDSSQSHGRGRQRRSFIKFEGLNVGGSIKTRTALI